MYRVQALLTKLAKNPTFRAQLLVFGRDERLGGSTQPYQLERLVQSSPELCDVLPARDGAVGDGCKVAGWSWLNAAWLLQRGLEQTKRELLASVKHVRA